MSFDILSCKRKRDGVDGNHNALITKYFHTSSLLNQAENTNEQADNSEFLSKPVLSVSDTDDGTDDSIIIIEDKMDNSTVSGNSATIIVSDSVSDATIRTPYILLHSTSSAASTLNDIGIVIKEGMSAVCRRS